MKSVRATGEFELSEFELHVVGGKSLKNIKTKRNWIEFRLAGSSSSS